MGWVYGIQCGGFIKIGVASDIKRRLHQMRLLNPHTCEVIFQKQAREPRSVEYAMHKLLEPWAAGREWFEINTAMVHHAYEEAITIIRKRPRQRTEWVGQRAARESCAHPLQMIEGRE
jgi:hypothetical protein